MVVLNPQDQAPVQHSAVKRSGCPFGREARLLNSDQFARVFKQNERSTDRYWTLLYTRNGVERPRLGMAVAKKKIKKAVDRNRVKRIVRDSFRTATELSGIDIVVLPSANCQRASNAELRNSLDKHWQRIALKCSR